MKERNTEKNTSRRGRYILIYIALVSALAVVFVLNINSGSIDVSPADVFKIIFFGDGGVKQYNVIWKIRLPRVLMAAILGGALSTSGLLLQTFFENPIAGPFVLGISSGAKMAVALTMLFILSRASAVSSWTLIISAFVGSLISMGFILLFSRRLKKMSTLLIAGIMIGYICSAITDFIITFADESDIVNLRNWSQGSFSGMSWENVRVAAVVVGVAMVFAFLLSKSAAAYRLGESYALSIGVSIRLFRVVLILLSSILSATVTAFAGPVSFVGIAAPFLVKRLLGTSKPIVVIPATFLGGALFCMLCDLIARSAFSPLELNISTVTALFGAPVVIIMLLGRRGGRA